MKDKFILRPTALILYLSCADWESGAALPLASGVAVASGSEVEGLLASPEPLPTVRALASLVMMNFFTFSLIAAHSSRVHKAFQKRSKILAVEPL